MNSENRPILNWIGKGNPAVEVSLVGRDPRDCRTEIGKKNLKLKPNSERREEEEEEEKCESNHSSIRVRKVTVDSGQN